MAKVRKFVKVISDDVTVNKIQDNIEQALQPVINSLIVNGALLEAIELPSGDSLVDHKLGRQIRGYVVVSKSAAVDVYDYMNDATDTTDKTRFLKLNSSAAATVNLWVF